MRKFLSWTLGSLAIPGLAAAQCENAPTHPDPPQLAVERAPDPPYETARHTEGYGDAYLGVGHLEPDGAEHYYDWHAFVTIPLYRGPFEDHIGWIIDGWVMLGSSRTPFTYAGTTETEYERATLIVLESTDDGWIRIRYDRASTAWTHRCALSLGEVTLTVRLWSDIFMSEGAPPLYFRERVRHALRVEPSVASDRVAWIGVDDEVEPLEIQGEWMRVRIYQPGKFLWTCSGEGPWEGESRIGWIRWWDDEKGPWLYWHTRGC